MPGGIDPNLDPDQVPPRHGRCHRSAAQLSWIEAVLRRRTPTHGGQPTQRQPDAAALLHELIEALSALGNYLAAARHDLAGPEPQRPRLGAALDKSQQQYARATAAVVRLREFLGDATCRNDLPSRR